MPPESWHRLVLGSSWQDMYFARGLYLWGTRLYGPVFFHSHDHLNFVHVFVKVWCWQSIVVFVIYTVCLSVLEVYQTLMYPCAKSLMELQHGMVSLDIYWKLSPNPVSDPHKVWTLLIGVWSCWGLHYLLAVCSWVFYQTWAKYCQEKKKFPLFSVKFRNFTGESLQDTLGYNPIIWQITV